MGIPLEEAYVNNKDKQETKALVETTVQSVFDTLSQDGRTMVVNIVAEPRQHIIRRKLRPNVLYLASLLTFIELMLSVSLFVLLRSIIQGQGAVGGITVTTVEALGIGALFAAWLILMGTIIGGLVSVMAQVAEEQPEKQPPMIPMDSHERQQDKLLTTLKDLAPSRP